MSGSVMYESFVDTPYGEQRIAVTGGGEVFVDGKNVTEHYFGELMVQDTFDHVEMDVRSGSFPPENELLAFLKAP